MFNIGTFDGRREEEMIVQHSFAGAAGFDETIKVLSNGTKTVETSLDLFGFSESGRNQALGVMWMFESRMALAGDLNWQFLL